MKKSISQRDIARMLNINVSTVSRALKGLPGVSTELRQEIVKLANNQSYRPNPFAMSLRHNTTQTIGVVIPDLSFSHYAHIVRWIEGEARKAGYMCIITDSGDKYDGEVECLERLMNLHVEGIALCLSQETTDFAHLERIRERHVPLVLFDRVADFDCPTVSFNDVESARQATLHLIDSGARRIAYLGGPNRIKQASDRKHGYLEALRERGLDIRKELVKCGHVSFNSGLSDALELISQPERPDAILADYGLLTIAAFQAIVSRGLRIPEDISIIGFMSDWVSGMTYPRLTFVKQNSKEMGSKVVELLAAQFNGDESTRHLIIKAQLNIRESTRK